MIYLISLSLIIIIIAVSIWIGRLSMRKSKPLKETKSNAPKETMKILAGTTPDPSSVLDAAVEEWKQTIATQMHFNDLIIRFRTIVLTAFSTIVAALAALTKALESSSLSKPSSGLDTNAQLQLQNALEPVGYTLLSLWVVAFLIDALYYHRLLIGAVKHANKFDCSDAHDRFQLFGLTESINRSVSTVWSYILVVGFYVIPLIAALWVRNKWNLSSCLP